jgi:hypothetical protein
LRRGCTVSFVPQEGRRQELLEVRWLSFQIAHSLLIRQPGAKPRPDSSLMEKNASVLIPALEMMRVLG